MLSGLTSFTAVTPGEAWQVREGAEEVKEGPGNNDDIVNILQEDHHDCGVTNTLSKWICKMYLSLF